MKKAWLLGLLIVGCQSPSAQGPVEHIPSIVKKGPGEESPTPPPVENDKPSRVRLYALKDLEKGKVKIPGRTIDAWIMDDNSKRAEGMMWLSEDEVKPDEGMLFAFTEEKPQSFWMRNTLIPLDIVYIDAKGKVVSIANGKAEDETPLPSAGPAKYVLELKSGEASKLKIQPGVVLGLPKVNPVP